jgi:hypothetical protein
VGRQRGRGRLAEVVAPARYEQLGRHLPERCARRDDGRGPVVEVRRRDREPGDGSPGQFGAHTLEQRRSAPDPPEEAAGGLHGLCPWVRGAVERRLDLVGNRLLQRDTVGDSAQVLAKGGERRGAVAIAVASQPDLTVLAPAAEAEVAAADQQRAALASGQKDGLRVKRGAQGHRYPDNAVADAEAAELRAAAGEALGGPACVGEDRQRRVTAAPEHRSQEVLDESEVEVVGEDDDVGEVASVAHELEDVGSHAWSSARTCLPASVRAYFEWSPWRSNPRSASMVNTLGRRSALRPP